MKKVSIGVIVAAFVIAGAFFVWKDFQMNQQNSVLETPKRAGASSQPSTGVAGTGYSTAANSRTAVKEAINMALAKSGKNQCDFCIIFAASGSDFPSILAEARKILGDKTRIFGGSSSAGSVMTEQGFFKTATKAADASGNDTPGALVVMTISTKDIVFGSAAVNMNDFASTREAAAAAIRKAIQSAGRTIEDKPKAIMVYAIRGLEEDTVAGIESVTGKDVPMFGGTSGSPKRIVMGNEGAFDKGVSVAVIYTDLPVGLAFEAGFDVTTDKHSGVVTKVNGQEIEEIDGRPAITVYNEWMDGEVDRLANKEKKDPAEIKMLLTLHPIYRKLTSPEGQDYYLFSHPWPKDVNLVDKTICTSTNIMSQQRLYLSHGTWETLMSRVGNVATAAKMHGGIEPHDKPILTIGIICNGVMNTIPEEERSKFPYLVNYATGGCSTIATFTGGEQGHFPGIGNRHGNLFTSFLVIGSEKKN